MREDEVTTSNMAAVMALAISATETAFPFPAGSPTPLGGLRPNGGKFSPFAISTRERSRLAWRSRVDAAARAWAGTEKCRNYAGCVDWLTDVSDRPIRRRRFLIGPPAYAPHEEADTLDAALAAPRPWRSQRKPDPRLRYSRSHRLACRKCSVAGHGWRIGQVSGYALKFEPNGDYLCVELRNPHGRSYR